MTLDMIERLLALGPAGLLAIAAFGLWRERNELQGLLLAEKQARLDDAKQGTTALLAIAERVHAVVDRLEERRP